MNEQEFINSIIVQVDEFFDARGAQKARLGLEIINKLVAVRDGLKKTEDAHKQQVKLLEDQIKALTEPKPVEEGGYRVGGETVTLDFTGGDGHADADAE